MNRKMIYIVSLVGFFLVWGVFGSAAAAPRREAALQAAALPVENTPVIPAGTEDAGIPVTAEPERLWRDILGFYGLIGLAALFLVLALLRFASQLTAPVVERNVPPSEEIHKN